MGPEPATAECAEIAVLGFVVAGTVNADVNTRAVARYLGGSVALQYRTLVYLGCRAA